MTPQEAKEILSRYRKNTTDESDPDFTEALQLARANPELSQWLLDQQEFHSTIRRQMQAIEVPRDLQSKILTSLPREPKVTTWRRNEFLALAASIVLILGAALFWTTRSSNEQIDFAGWRSRMVSFALRTYQMDILTNDEKKVRTHLAEKGAPADFEVTPGLAKLPVKGGGRLSWQNRPVAMICYGLPNNETLYMFVIDENSVPGPKPPNQPKIDTDKRLATASWTTKGKVYLMAAATDPNALQNLAP